MADAVTVIEGDCLDVLRGMTAGTFDGVVTDPPYELGFMGQTWDSSGVAFRPETWASVLNAVRPGGFGDVGAETGDTAPNATVYADTGTAARFFYAAKASKAERGDGNNHPTVKPIELCEWLVRLICPVGGLVLDPFAGSGSTGKAALAEGRRAVLIEKDPTYCKIIRRRLRGEK